MENSTEPIIVEQIFKTPVQQVWEAITVLDQMTKWFFPNIPSFKAVVGFETQFIVQSEDRIFPHKWTVTEVIPMKKIAYEWQFDGYPGKAISIYEIEGEGSYTKLRLTAAVLEEFPDHIPEFKRESGVAGWNYFIKGSLKGYLEPLKE